ncbi:MAG TPA: glycosyltransferase [Bacteroidetes bacterium]|nr:glycosyltransferase [Bacteroidota bacterium]
MFFWLIKRLFRAKIIYIWFCDYHAFLPALLGRIFGKKTIIIFGGFDAMNLPEFNYGGFTQGIRGKIIRMSSKLAHLLLPVSEFTYTHLAKNAGPFVKQKSQVLYNGIDLSLFPPFPEIERTQIVCISAATGEITANIKGIDRFLTLAEAIPNRQFTLIGTAPEFLQSYWKRPLPSNLKVIKWTPRETLQTHLQSSKIICQLSRSESFGLALAEGMLCGCIPLTIANLGAAEVVNPEFGYILPQWDLSASQAAIEAAFNRTEALALANRRHVETSFSLEIRAEKLLAIIASN